MPLASSGPLGLDNIQAEFGGTLPIQAHEYYRGGPHVTVNNTSVPASGPISVNNFFSTFKTASAAELGNLLRNPNYSVVRNALISTSSFGNGIETNPYVTFTSHLGGSYRFSTVITNTYVLPSSFHPVFEPALRAGYVTIVLVNIGNGGLNETLTVNGVPRGITNIAYVNRGGVDVRVDYFSMPLPYNGLANLNVSVTYYKGSINRVSCQELFILPGKWDPAAISTPVGYSPGVLTYSAQPDDILLGFRTGDYDQYYDDGSWGGSSPITQIMRRNVNWYINESTHFAIVNGYGSVTYTPGGFTTYTSSGLVQDTYSWYGLAILFRFTG